MLGVLNCEDQGCIFMNLTGMDLNRFILEEERRFPTATGSLSIALTTISSAAKLIASRVRMAGLSDTLYREGRGNGQGEDMQKLDDYANEVLIQHLSHSGQFFILASAEVEDAIFPENGKEGRYVISFDPLDGSSNMNVNVNIGTIFSIHKREDGSLADMYQEGYKQVAAGYVVYGSSTMLVYSTGNGVNGFTLDPSSGLFLMSHPNMTIPERGNIYSVNDGHYAIWDKKFRKYIDSLRKKGYSSRYVGTMVADVHRTLIKGGIFAYPADEKNTGGKLRILYEASPMAYLVRQAGGKATTGHEDILSLKPESVHERVPVFLGSSLDIDDLLKTL